MVETPTMAAAGKRAFQDDRLTFHDNLETAVTQLGSLDLIIAQGVLQYMKDPLQTLETLLKLGFAYVYITRTMVGVGIERPIISKQVVNLSAHGPGAIPKGVNDRKTSQPLTIVPFEFITSRILGSSTVLYSFIEGENSFMWIGSRKVTVQTVGFLLKSSGNRQRIE